ncbi:MAG: hypothetical protein AAF518_06555 [Spirochaetota bacterium]
MTPQEFTQRIEEESISKSLFSIYDLPGDGMYTIQFYGDHYKVYYFERGIQEYQQDFPSEGEALEYLLQLLRRDARR